MAKRWTCPSCGNGKLAPERPRKDDVRRYCLPCSESSGRLTERRCEALEKRRASKAVARRAKAQRAREASRTKAEAYPQNLAGLFEAWKRSADWDKPARVASYKLTLRVRRKASDYTSGHCYYNEPKVVITAGRDAADAYMVILHELAHADQPYKAHSAPFYASMLQAARSVTGEPCKAPDAPDRFSVNRVVVDAFRKMIERGALPADERPRPEPPALLVSRLGTTLIRVPAGRAREEFDNALWVAAGSDIPSEVRLAREIWEVSSGRYELRNESALLFALETLLNSVPGINSKAWRRLAAAVGARAHDLAPVE